MGGGETGWQKKTFKINYMGRGQHTYNIQHTYIQQTGRPKCFSDSTTNSGANGYFFGTPCTYIWTSQLYDLPGPEGRVSEKLEKKKYSGRLPIKKDHQGSDSDLNGCDKLNHWLLEIKMALVYWFEPTKFDKKCQLDISVTTYSNLFSSLSFKPISDHSVSVSVYYESTAASAN